MASAAANDLFLAVRGADDASVQGALAAGADTMFVSRESKGGQASRRAHRTIGRAVRELPGHERRRHLGARRVRRARGPRGAHCGP